MKKIITIAIIITIASSGLFLNGCAPTKAITEKTGAQLWGENCNRCHSAPTADQYSKEHWEVIGEHMKSRANVTDEEMKKITTFLKGEM